VNTYDELFKHPQTETMGVFTWSEQAAVGRVPHPNVPGPQPFKLDAPSTRVPRVGEHSRDILAELGYTAQDIRRMFDQAVVFEPSAQTRA
jgi:crotonobetainyl-CoA:carnitine CoA-transferase CaiB-like acyl-CoA transferase